MASWYPWEACPFLKGNGGGGLAGGGESWKKQRRGNRGGNIKTNKQTQLWKDVEV